MKPLPFIQVYGHRIARFAASWCVMLLVASLPAHAIADGSGASEFAVKAAIIFKIAKFVSWPESAFSSQSEQLTACVQKDNPIAAALSALNGKPIHGRVFSVRYMDKFIRNHEGCQILFLNDEHREQELALLDVVANRPVLTIGDTDQFIDRGGIVGLIIEQNHIRFEINLAASETAGLNISAQLLQLAKITDNRQGS